MTLAHENGGAMWRLATRARDLGRMLTRGRGAYAWGAITGRVYANSRSLGLARDLAVPFAAPEAKIPITVRPLAGEDDLSFLDVNEPGITGQQLYGRLAQRRLLDADIPTCYVAIAPGNRVCYMQWLIAPDQDEQVRSVFGALFPRLGSDEALLEGAFTVEAFRGQGIMACAMAQIAERARALRVGRVITFVDEHNVPSLKGCQKAGFSAYVSRLETYRLLWRRVHFMSLEVAPPPVT